MDHSDRLILQDNGQDLVLLCVILYVHQLLYVLLAACSSGPGQWPLFTLDPAIKARPLEVSVVSDNEPRVGEKREQDQGRGGEHEEGG